MRATNRGSVRIPKMGRVTSICRKLRLIFKKIIQYQANVIRALSGWGNDIAKSSDGAGTVSTLPATQSQYIQEPLDLVLFAENAVLLLFG